MMCHGSDPDFVQLDTMKKQRVVVGGTSHKAALKYHLDFDIFTLDLKLVKVSHHLSLLLIWSRAEQLHWLHCEAHCKWFVPLPTLMMLPLDFWANFEEISSLFMQKWAAAVCRHLSNYGEVSFITRMHWVFLGSFNVAIKSLLWGSLLRSWIFPLLVGQMGSSLFLAFACWALGQSLFGTQTGNEYSLVWEGSEGCSLKGHEPVWCIITPVLQRKKCVQIMCTCVDRVCFFLETVFVFFLLTGDHPFVSC